MNAIRRRAQKREAKRTPTANADRPIVNLSFAINYAMGGLSLVQRLAAAIRQRAHEQR